MAKIKCKYKVKQVSSLHPVHANKWAIWKDAKHFYNNEFFDNEADAVYASLIREGQEIVSKLDNLQTRLEATGRIRESDPYGWRS